MDITNDSETAMIFQGQALQCDFVEPGLAELCFDLQGESVNKFNRATLEELDQALTALEAESSVRGLLLTSAKEVFIVGADITEFLSTFQKPEAELIRWIESAQALFSRLEDMPLPSVAAINGIALGGGMELCLAATYRVMAEGARIGQPEVKLGLIPGFGGTVRLCRLIGVDNALDLVTTGRELQGPAALKMKLVSACVAPDKLKDAALHRLKRAIAEDNWRPVQELKRQPVLLNTVERAMSFSLAKGLVAQKAGPNYPAPLEAVSLMEKAAGDGRAAAMAKEAASFAKLAKSAEAENLIGIFFADQTLKKISKDLSMEAGPLRMGGVLGAGIMGGGIAYQSASRGVPVVMKDIRSEAIAQGMGEASRLLSRQVERGRITRDQMAQTLSAIQGTLTYGDFAHVDLVVEAVVENVAIKKAVLAELEQCVGPETTLSSNTSTIPIDTLASALKDPSRFCGMHFFNPVYRMPLVEVIRGKDSTARTIAHVVAYAVKLGKTPVVVNDGPGFLVNRVLFSYMAAFQSLVMEGAPIERIDKAMERFGWPMGPAWLSDVIGLDTAHHAGSVMAAAFPDRIDFSDKSPTSVLFKAGSLGEKNGKGYYRYEPDRRGRNKKVWDPALTELLAPVISGGAEDLSNEAIVERMMIPMIIEASRCLEDDIVATVPELDMAMIMGIGFPPFRGGLMRYADNLGLDALSKQAEQYSALGPLFQPTAQIQELSQQGRKFYSP